ncbi:putative quinol monooxygenase [Achromobacter marplatensis]|uniref:putative quinol monooxygenase n=1 Tax=Achromobacter marplatensis TaxID=470868 RepID=UPI0039F6A8C0
MQLGRLIAVSLLSAGSTTLATPISAQQPVRSAALDAAVSSKDKGTMSNQKLVSIAILKAKPGKAEILKSMLLALIEPTRAEPGNLDYVLFELTDQPGTFYMREAFVDKAALDAHFATSYFQAFEAQMDSVLAEPIRLQFLTQVSS